MLIDQRIIFQSEYDLQKEDCLQPLSQKQFYQNLCYPESRLLNSNVLQMPLPVRERMKQAENPCVLSLLLLMNYKGLLR
ncbi:hypothetical protein DSECCO2_624800 [anaerobic digester metagenome]